MNLSKAIGFLVVTGTLFFVGSVVNVPTTTGQMDTIRKANKDVSAVQGPVKRKFQSIEDEQKRRIRDSAVFNIEMVNREARSLLPKIKELKKSSAVLVVKQVEKEYKPLPVPIPLNIVNSQQHLVDSLRKELAECGKAQEKKQSKVGSFLRKIF